MSQQPPDATNPGANQTATSSTGRTDDSHTETTGERTVLNPSEGGLAFLGENLLTLFTIVVPTFFLWIIVARIVPHLRLVAYIAGLGWALTSATFLFARYDWMSNREFVASISRFYTQPPDMLFDRFPTTSGIEQPDRSNPVAWLARKPPFKYLPVIGATNQTRRPQDLVPLKRPFEHSPAIESQREYRRGGGVRGNVTTVIGAIRVEPPNIVTDDRSSWQQSAKWFAAALDSAFEGNSQLYEPMRSANYEPRVFRYRLCEQQLRYRDRFDPAQSGDDPLDLALADYAQERGDNVSLRDITALVRDYYVVHEVTPTDVIDVESGVSGGIRSVPGIGHAYTEIKKWQLQQSDEYVEEMASHLEYRLEKMAHALQKITGLRCSVVPSEHFSQAIADHYQAANVYAHANFRDLIRQSPQPAGYRNEDELVDLLDHVPEGFENPEETGEELNPETRRILGFDNPDGSSSGPDNLGPSPAARGTRLNYGAQEMAEYGVAWEEMGEHPMARTGVLRDGDLNDARDATAADGNGTVPAESEQSSVDHHVAENGGPVDFDIVQDYDSDFFAQWYKSLLCAEDNVNRADPNYLVIDDQQFVATLMITHWPPDIDPGFLEPILRFEDPAVAVSMSTHIHDLDQNRLEMELADEENERASKVEKVASSRFPVFLERFKAQHAATQEMLESVTNSDHDTFETNTYLEVRAHTPRSLYKAIDMIKNRLRSEGAAATLLKHNHEKGHQTVAPICDDQINHSVKMRSDGLGCLNPWTVRNLYDDSGIEVGENMAANEPLAYDFWKRTLAPHFGMWTESGGGKTTLATIMFNRLLTLQPDDFFLALIDPLEEFVNLSELHGGERIVVGGSKGMNPLHGSATPADKLDVVGHDTPYNEWKEGGIDFMALYYDALDIEFTSAKQTVWSKAITLIGEQYGITDDPRTLDPEYRVERQQVYFDSNEASETSEIDEPEAELSIEERAAAYVRAEIESEQSAEGDIDDVDEEDENGEKNAIPADVADPDVDPREWPTLIDAAAIIEDMSDDAAKPEYVKNPDNDKQVEDRRNVATDIVNNDIEQLSPGGKYDHFGKPNEIEIPEDAAFVYADMQLGEGDRSAGLEMHVLLDLFYDHAKAINLKSMIFCDEFHYLLRDDTVMESLNHKFRHGRHWDLAIGVASQSYRDLFGTDKDGKIHLTDNAEVMFENMSAQFYLRNDIGYKWGKKLGLSREETKFVNDAQIGEVLFRVENVGTYPVEVVMDIRENPRETVITEYDPNTHGTNFLAYLEQHRDICDWEFPPVDVTDAPPANIDARAEMGEDDADAFDPYTAGATAPTGTSAGAGGGGSGGGGDD